ncbi:MAG TPA: acetate--CoA ligase, partial [Actinomycetota bacterium]|nr:acetate--CoA ligase [Actinomycetota bacterium]
MRTEAPAGHAIDALFLEERRYEPPDDFAAQANARPDIYERDFEEFWETEGRERVTWFEPFEKLYEWEPPYAKWYLGGKLNVCFNCVDRHVETGSGEKVAYHWEGEPVGERRTVTFADLQRDVVRFANGLKKLGVRKGTPVAIYMGMVPELPVAMLACARLGAPHTVVFGGFSADALADRMNDMECEVLITQDEGWRKGNRVPLKRNADDALATSPGVRHAVVLRRTEGEVAMEQARDVSWDELCADVSDDPESCPCEPMDSEDLLYLLYTSGTTAKPKGIVHTTAGYLVGVATTHHYIFDVKPDSIYWCAADIGWVTGHSYIVYGPLCNGTTSVLYEGTPDYPDKDRWWEIVERYEVDILYTAPTAIRAHMKWGPEHAEKHDLSSLRLLGSVGEPINPEAWEWYRRHIGGGRTPVVDTWWQTETGMIMISPLPGVTTLKPGSATRPFPGVDAAVYDEQGNEVGPGGGGYLVLRRPWPAMLRGLYKEHDRYVETYWTGPAKEASADVDAYEDVYFTGDGARIDEDGDFWLLGRVDDVMNVSGHRISTIEVESALVDHPRVAEAAVCGRNDALTG